jgi:anti-sigma28 factor (negative regulator of flagellin synthesis)
MLNSKKKQRAQPCDAVADDLPLDASRVQAVREALADGTCRFDAGKVADRLIGSGVVARKRR